MQRLSRPALIGLATLTAVVILLPLVVTNHFAIDICIRILLFAFIGVAWNLMGGYAKQLSLGHAAYFGLGAYTSTIMRLRISRWYSNSAFICGVSNAAAGCTCAMTASCSGRC